MSGKLDKFFDKSFGKISLEEIYLANLVLRFRESWNQQGLDERKRRMHFVLEMGAELGRIRASGVQHATAWCEKCIEAVITGSADDLRMCMSVFDFKGEDTEHRGRYAPVFAAFKELCEAALLTRTMCHDGASEVERS